MRTELPPFTSTATEVPAGAATAAAPAALPERPAYRSPEVLPDGRVRFRLWAPRAHEVAVNGTFRFYARGPWPQTAPGPFALARDDGGLWTYETPPLKPGFYNYGFHVDGVPVVDPQNPYSRPLGLGTSRSYLDVPGPPGSPAIHEPRPGAARGTTHVETFFSRVLDQDVGLWVYTPPGYPTATTGAAAARVPTAPLVRARVPGPATGLRGREGPADGYPVLYLLHGRGDDERGWYYDGRAAVVLDNLLAAGAIRPVVVAMPYGQLTPLPGRQVGGAHPIDAARPATATVAAASASGATSARTPGGTSARIPGSTTDAVGPSGARAAGGPVPLPPNPREGEYFLDEVAGLVDRRYQVRRDPAGRAMAGLSMGGGQSLRLLVKHPGWCAAAGAFSSALLGGGGSAAGDEAQVRPALAHLRLLYLARGHLESDRLSTAFDRLAAVAREAAPALPDLTLHVDVKRGGHEWQVWIRCLAEFLRLWQPAA